MALLKVWHKAELSSGSSLSHEGCWDHPVGSTFLECWSFRFECSRMYQGPGYSLKWELLLLWVSENLQLNFQVASRKHSFIFAQCFCQWTELTKGVGKESWEGREGCLWRLRAAIDARSPGAAHQTQPASHPACAQCRAGDLNPWSFI